MNLLPIKRVLISVSDKTGIVEFARQLREFDVDIISTGGTLSALRSAGIEAISVSEVTKFPEILDGRVKTLHPAIHAGLLARTGDPSHQEQLEELSIQPIDMVVVNLYPFEETTKKKDLPLDEAIEQIDVGGPSMLRAAAKNFRYKAVISDPARYQPIIEELRANGGAITEATRFELAKEVFRHTSHYDAVISTYLSGTTDALPEMLSISLAKTGMLRYGENPHQAAALYGEFSLYFEKLHGKELSYNNIVDIQAAAELIGEFTDPTAVIIKHTNPAGAGSASTISAAYAKALATDSKSAFGGIVALNRPLDMATSVLIDGIFTEVVIAPDFPPEVLEWLRRKKDRRLIRQLQPAGGEKRLIIKCVAGGVLAQTGDDISLDEKTLRIVTKRAPTDEEHRAMLFGWRIAKHVKSNAIVYARSDRTVGVGAGQMSRFDSSRIAVMKAREAGLDLKGTAVASDAFFPFADGLLEAVRAGATAVIEPGGSVRDEEVIKAADENNVAMVFTGIRHFKH